VASSSRVRDIYGGLQGVFDYGPLGVELKNNIINAWWRTNVYARDDMEGLDAAILMNKLVWKYSATKKPSTIPWSTAKVAKGAGVPDHIKGKCPACGSSDLTEARPFNMMFKTAIAGRRRFVCLFAPRNSPRYLC
jgi:glycyl-tRNA synthetase